MSQMLEDAIAKLRALPRSLQEELAREINNVAVMEGGADGVYMLSDAEKEAVAAGRADIAAERTVSYEEFRQELNELIGDEG